MIRRKKLLKLGKKPVEQKSREDRLFEEMVAKCVQNNKARQTDKKYKKEQRQKAAAKYYESFPYMQVIEPNKDWMEGVGAKRTVFDAVRLDKIDVDEINARRKEANIEVPIEQAAQEAIEEAKRKATRVAVVCHKSSYQYIGDGKDAKHFGKKSSQSD